MPPLLLAAVLALAALPPGRAAASARCPDSAHRVVGLTLEAPALERVKRVLVYLPPGYGCGQDRRYPVPSLTAGHDLFERAPFAAALAPPLAAEIARREGWYGSWRLDVQLDAAIAAGRLPPLVAVGIASDDGMRSRDLSPAPWSGSDEARGAA